MKLNLTANGTSDSFEFQGKGTVFARGTFDGATVALESAPMDSNDFDSVESITDEDTFNLDIARCRIRANVTDADTNTDIELEIRSFRDVG